MHCYALLARLFSEVGSVGPKPGKCTCLLDTSLHSHLSHLNGGIRFVYNPDSLKDTLFPDHKSRSLTATGSSDSSGMDVDEPAGTAADDGVSDVKQPPSLFVHTRSETFLIYPQSKASPSPPSSDDKENTQDAAGGWRYAIAVVSHTPPAVIHKPSDTSVSTPVEAPAPSPSAAEEAPEATKDASSSEGSVVDMSISPSESSKPSINGDVLEPVTETGPSTAEDRTADATETEDKDAKQEKTASTEESTTTAKTTEDGIEKADETGGKAQTKPAAADKSAEDQIEPAPTKTAEAQSMPPKEPVSKKPQPTLQVLQRDLSAEQFIFDEDGVGVVSTDVENGAQKGWKIEVKSWRLAGVDALPLIQTVV